jgi:hypothetical protein
MVKCYVRIKPGGEIDTYILPSKYYNTFDKIFNENTTSDDVYKEVILPHITSTIVFYGQTNTGKTYTSSFIIKKLLFSGSNVSIKAMEIYNNECYDLLTNRNKVSALQHCVRIHIRENKDGHKVFNCIKSTKIVKNNGYNKYSSRSHIIYEITVNGTVYIIVDLAGMELVVNNESHFINLSLYALRECIQRLGAKKIPPYRNSKLTYCLKDYLSKNLICVCTISSMKQHELNNLRTMEYGISMKHVRNIRVSSLESNMMKYNTHTLRVGQLETKVINEFLKTKERTLLKLLHDLLQHRLELTKEILGILTTTNNDVR